jgi:hypothetical protein
MARCSIPHSWSINTWPADVYPHDPARARYLVRANRDNLLMAGALARVGRELVILGDRYAKWMERQAAAVPDYDCPANSRDSR